jgi:NADH-quinone oxidoreductase subunit J
MFALVMLGAALGVVFSRNPVHAVMFLVLTFFQSACLWLLAEAEFLAIVLVLVYVGAVMVLFLFVVMMLDIEVETIQRSLTRYASFGIGVALLMAFELVQLIWYRSQDDVVATGFAPTPEGYSNTKALGSVLYTEHVYAFEIAAVILLLAIVAAITLTMRKRPGLKVQNIAKQVAVRAKDRIRVVKMDAEKKR